MTIHFLYMITHALMLFTCDVETLTSSQYSRRRFEDTHLRQTPYIFRCHRVVYQELNHDYGGLCATNRDSESVMTNLLDIADLKIASPIWKLLYIPPFKASPASLYSQNPMNRDVCLSRGF